MNADRTMKLNTPLIYGLLLCVLLISVPHAAHLPLWVSSQCAVLLFWRAYLAYFNRALPPRWLLLTIITASVGGILITFHTLFGREVGVTLLILLAALKLLEVRSARDATIVIYLACFVIITGFFYSQSLLTALLMFVTLLVVVTTWVHLQCASLALRPRLQIGGMLLLQAIPLTLVLFVLFPRVQGPLWGLPQDAYATSGLDDKMSPGSVGKLTLSDAVAFRVMFKDKPPRRDQMYWRGPVLWNFDGHTWTPGPGGFSRIKPAQLDKLSDPVDYTVTLEPHNKTWLFSLEMPTRISVPAAMSYDFQLLQQTTITSRLRYTVHSQLGYHANSAEDPRQLQRALNIPRDLNPRARQLAASWRAVSSIDEEIVRAALAYFNREGFQYTLSPAPLGNHEVDDFLFVTHQGFCEHYASSFVFLMRAAGVPARVVTGYQGAEYNNFGKYYIVRQSDAHAWAEVWLRERGWVRVDPTAAIAPARVELGMAAALPQSDNAALPFLERTQAPWLINFRFNMDALTHQWNQWVLGYNPERQFAFLTRLGMEEITWQKMAFSLLGGVAFLTGLLALLMLRQLTRQKPPEVQRLYLKFCRKLASHGIVRDVHEGPQDFASRVARLKPQLASAVGDITAQYIALRYGQQFNSPAAEPHQAGRSWLKLLRGTVRPASSDEDNQGYTVALLALRRTVAAFKL
jgi:transglutaminase-like putative cysteine protease